MAGRLTDDGKLAAAKLKKTVTKAGAKKPNLPSVGKVAPEGGAAQALPAAVIHSGEGSVASVNAKPAKEPKTAPAKRILKSSSKVAKSAGAAKVAIKTVAGPKAKPEMADTKPGKPAKAKRRAAASAAKKPARKASKAKSSSTPAIDPSPVGALFTAVEAFFGALFGDKKS